MVRVAVIGAGIVGLATALALRDAGAEVLCFEQRAAMGERSAGSSRIFRHAHGAPELVALALRARADYRVWEQRCGQTLVGCQGLVITGEIAQAWGEAMAAAGAPYRLASKQQAALRLPTARAPQDAVIDDGGGVLYAGAAGEFLVAAVGDALVPGQVYALDDRSGGVVVRASNGDMTADAVVICAGAGAPALAAQAGLYLPVALAHHVRLSFPLRRQAEDYACWIGPSARGLDTYQHRTAGGLWAIGAHFDAASVCWEAGPARAAALAREAITQYVAEELDLVEPVVAGELRCTIDPGRGDGLHFARAGRVLAVYGENLFKFAPLLGKWAAAAALDGSTPASVAV